MAPTLGAIIFPPVPNLGIGSSTQDDDVIMENTAMVPQVSSAHTTAMVLLTLLVHDTMTVPSASPAHTITTVPQALSVNTTTMVPQALSANTDAMVPQASSANTSASLDVDATNMSTLTIMEADKKATAEIYS